MVVSWFQIANHMATKLVSFCINEILYQVVRSLIYLLVSRAPIISDRNWEKILISPALEALKLYLPPDVFVVKYGGALWSTLWIPAFSNNNVKVASIPWLGGATHIALRIWSCAGLISEQDSKLADVWALHVIGKCKKVLYRASNSLYGLEPTFSMLYWMEVLLVMRFQKFGHPDSFVKQPSITSSVHTWL